MADAGLIGDVSSLDFLAFHLDGFFKGDGWVFVGVRDTVRVVVRMSFAFIGDGASDLYIFGRFGALGAFEVGFNM